MLAVARQEVAMLNELARAELRRTGRLGPDVFDCAGHGFARDQSGKNGANLAAIQQAWPKALAWFRKYLGP